MKKIVLAVGHRGLENFLENRLRNEFQFVGRTVYREGILRTVSQTSPDIVVIRETLEGQENIMDIVYEIQVQFSYARVIFVAGDREPGDTLLSTLVSYGVYDILHGSKVSAPEIMRLIRQPNTRKDVAYLQPKPILDEQRNKLLFDTPEHAPSERVIIKEVVKEVFVDPDGDPIEREPVFSRPENNDTNKGTTNRAEPKTKEETSPLVEDLPVFTSQNLVTDETDENKTEEKEEEGEKKGFFSSSLGRGREKESTPKRKGVRKRRNQKTMTIPTIEGAKEGATMLTFIGGKHGLGVTSIGISLAAALSEKYKVLYVEVNSESPATPYWYEISHLTKGIDTALLNIENNQYQLVNDNIILMEELKKVNDMQTIHKRFSKNIDFLTFSKSYVARREESAEVDEFLLKELYLHLLFQSGYDYIVLDVPPNMNNPATFYAFAYSHKIFHLLTQDVSVIGQTDFNLHELEKRGQNIKSKTQFILNKHEKSSIDIKDIEKWLQVSNIFTIPNANKEFINASFNGVPMFYSSRSSQWRTTWKNLIKSI